MGLLPGGWRQGHLGGGRLVNPDDEAASVRREFPRWVVMWLARAGEFRAYRALPGAHEVTTLSAPTASELAARITEAEQHAQEPHPAPPQGGNGPPSGGS